MDDKLEVKICSDIDYEKLIAEIYFDGLFVALISQEEGISNLKIEFPGIDQNEEIVLRKVSLNWFVGAIEVAKKKLIGIG